MLTIESVHGELSRMDEVNPCGNTCQECPISAACHTLDKDGPDVDPLELLSWADGSINSATFYNLNGDK